MAVLTPDLREVLARVGTSTLTGVLNRRGLKSMTLYDVWPMRPEQPRMVGIAFTMRFIPSREDKDGPASTSRSMVQPQAMEECPPGHVLMIDSRGDSRAASAGDLYIGRLKARGAAGIVTDGGFRDTDGVFKTGLPAYHRRPSSPPSPIAHRPVDLNLPTLVATVAAGLKLPAEALRRLRRALDRKDEAAVAKALGDKMGGDKKAADLFVGLLRAAGPAESGIARLIGLKLPAAGAAEAARLAEVVKLVRAADPDLPLTVDPVEYRGLEYQTGVSFSVFALKGRQELARGGRYSAGYPDDGASEPATGFTVYMDAVLAASEATPQQPRLYMPLGIAWREAAAWQAKGYAVVRAVAAAAEARSEAKRLNCSHALIDGDAVPL